MSLVDQTTIIYKGFVKLCIDYNKTCSQACAPKHTTILNFVMFSILSVQEFFDLDKSFVFYGRLKLTKVHFLMNLVRCYEKSGTSLFCDVIQGTRENRLLMQIHFILIVSHLHCARRIKNGE